MRERVANNRKEIVIVTGASSGIGEALVREYATLGARVILAARNVDRMAVIVKDIQAKGGEASMVKCDVTVESECQALIDESVKEWGAIDTLICSAGISMRSSFEHVSLDVLRRVMDVNFWGAVNCIKSALPHLIESRGSIVGISSLAGVHGLPQRTGYSASKYALTGFLEALRIELTEKEVHIMVACPGYTASRIRYSALMADGSTQDSSPRDEERMMSAKSVAKGIIKDTKNGRHLCLIGLEGHAVCLLKRLHPPLLDKIFARAGRL